MKTIRKISLPGYLKRYFWDVDFAILDAAKYPYFVIERILEYGDQNAVKWMINNFKKSEIERTLIKKRGLSPKSANHWALVFNIPRGKIICLKRSYQKMKERHWPY